VEAEIVAISREGGRPYNEDVYGHWNDGEFIACLISDGAGGHGGGNVAAAITRQTILDAFSAKPSIDRAAMGELIAAANHEIVARQSDSSAQSAMRATVVLVAIDIERKEMVWAHCGDSRAYLFRHGKMIARTKDHSLVQQMVESGMLDDEGARLHATRNLLLSALGSIAEPLEVSVSEVIKLQADDVLLLCSDGVWEPLGDLALATSLGQAASPMGWLELLEKQVKQLAKPDHDNYTALTLWTSDVNEATQLIPAMIQNGIT
jgi:PPM family protein phosphatase